MSPHELTSWAQAAESTHDIKGNKSQMEAKQTRRLPSEQASSKIHLRLRLTFSAQHMGKADSALLRPHSSTTVQDKMNLAVGVQKANNTVCSFSSSDVNKAKR